MFYADDAPPVPACQHAMPALPQLCHAACCHDAFMRVSCCMRFIAVHALPLMRCRASMLQRRGMRCRVYAFYDAFSRRRCRRLDAPLRLRRSTAAALLCALQHESIYVFA